MRIYSHGKAEWYAYQNIDSQTAQPHQVIEIVFDFSCLTTSCNFEDWIIDAYYSQKTTEDIFVVNITMYRLAVLALRHVELAQSGSRGNWQARLAHAPHYGSPLKIILLDLYSLSVAHLAPSALWVDTTTPNECVYRSETKNASPEATEFALK